MSLDSIDAQLRGLDKALATYDSQVKSFLGGDPKSFSAQQLLAIITCMRHVRSEANAAKTRIKSLPLGSLKERTAARKAMALCSECAKKFTQECSYHERQLALLAQRCA